MFLVIQGTADVDGKSTQAEISNTVDFTYNAIQRNPGEVNAVSQKMNGHSLNDMNGKTHGHGKDWTEVNRTALSASEKQVLQLAKDVFKGYFSADGYDGMIAHLKRGSLGLMKSMPANQVAVEG